MRAPASRGDRVIDKKTFACLEAFLEEDLGRGDITSEAVVDSECHARARVVAHQEGIVAGIEEARALCKMTEVEVTTAVRDGAGVEPGDEVLALQGPARGVLGVERTLLNLLSHMSGIATLTRAVVAAADRAIEQDGSIQEKPRIAATRKTLPGLRRFQKRAVIIGGADPHRFDLSEAILIKDNHIALAADAPTAIADARAAIGDESVEVEVETLDEALAAARAGADILLLDNMPPATIEGVCAALVAADLRDGVSLEASGGITIENVGDYACLPIDLISMSAITRAAPPLDFSLDIVD